MNVEILARTQFAVTIMFHYIYPVLSIGLSVVMVVIEGMYLWTKNRFYLDMAQFWTKIFALTFAVGVATGIVMEFEFGTNWATYSKYVGDVFGSALAAEGVFAFFLESGFLALLLFGWNLVGAGLHFFSTFMVCLGAHFSAVWIVVANSWMQTPAGFQIVGEGLAARAEITDFWAMVFNPSSMDRLCHVLIGAWLAGAFLVTSISAYYLLKKRFTDFAWTSMKVGLALALISVNLQLVSGDSSGRSVAKNQPAKLAGLEGLYTSTKGAPLTLMGLVNTKEQRVDYAVRIPKLLSFLAYRNFDAKVTGLDAFPPKDRPPTAIIFQTYRIMLACWGLMFVLAWWGGYLWWRGKLSSSKWTLRAFVIAVLFPQLANQAGWASAEIGRQPWIVYNLLRTSEGLSKAVTANQVLGSLIMFSLVYSFLFIMFIYLMNKKIKGGPMEEGTTEHYHAMEHYVEELHHD